MIPGWISQPQYAPKFDKRKLAEFSICGGFIYLPAYGPRPPNINPSFALMTDNTGSGYRPDLIYLSPINGPLGSRSGRFIQDNSSRFLATQTGAPSTQAFTFLSRVRVNATIGGAGDFARDAAGAGNTIPWWQAGGAFDMRIGGTDYTAAGTWTNGVWYDVEIVGSAASCLLDVDGVNVINGGAAAAGSIAADMCFGVVAGGACNSGDFDVVYMLFCNRALPAATRAKFRANPWQIFEPDLLSVFWPKAPTAPSVRPLFTATTGMVW